MESPNQRAIDLIKRFEGCKLEAYLCPAGIPTIGYGHTRSVELGDVITQEQAEELLAEDVALVCDELISCVDVPLTDGQIDALISFAYNVKGWRDSTLLRLVNEGRFAEAGHEFPKWNHCDGKVLAGLTNRRAAEQALFLS